MDSSSLVIYSAEPLVDVRSLSLFIWSIHAQPVDRR